MIVAAGATGSEGHSALALSLLDVGGRQTGEKGECRSRYTSSMIGDGRPYVLTVIRTGGMTQAPPTTEGLRGLLSGQPGHDGGEHFGEVGTEYEVGVADVLPSPLDLFGGRRRVIREYG